MNLEDELRSALGRREPSPDFAARVLARISAAPPRRVTRGWTRGVAGIAAAVMLAAGALEYRHYEGERAKEQVLRAVRIAAVKLSKAQKKVRMLNHRGNS
jgi:hypothetical protein